MQETDLRLPRTLPAIPTRSCRNFLMSGMEEPLMAPGTRRRDFDASPQGGNLRIAPLAMDAPGLPLQRPSPSTPSGPRPWTQLYSENPCKALWLPGLVLLVCVILIGGGVRGARRAFRHVAAAVARSISASPRAPFPVTDFSASLVNGCHSTCRQHYPSSLVGRAPCVGTGCHRMLGTLVVQLVVFVLHDARFGSAKKSRLPWRLDAARDAIRCAPARDDIVACC